MDRTEEPHPGPDQSVLWTEPATEAAMIKQRQVSKRPGRKKARDQDYDQHKYDGSDPDASEG